MSNGMWKLENHAEALIEPSKNSPHQDVSVNLPSPKLKSQDQPIDFSRKSDSSTNSNDAMEQSETDDSFDNVNLPTNQQNGFVKEEMNGNDNATNGFHQEESTYAGLLPPSMRKMHLNTHRNKPYDLGTRSNQANNFLRSNSVETSCPSTRLDTTMSAFSRSLSSPSSMVNQPTTLDKVSAYMRFAANNRLVENAGLMGPSNGRSSISPEINNTSLMDSRANGHGLPELSSSMRNMMNFQRSHSTDVSAYMVNGSSSNKPVSSTDTRLPSINALTDRSSNPAQVPPSFMGGMCKDSPISSSTRLSLPIQINGETSSTSVYLPSKVSTSAPHNSSPTVSTANGRSTTGSSENLHMMGLTNGNGTTHLPAGYQLPGVLTDSLPLTRLAALGHMDVYPMLQMNGSQNLEIANGDKKRVVRPFKAFENQILNPNFPLGLGAYYEQSVVRQTVSLHKASQVADSTVARNSPSSTKDISGSSPPMDSPESRHKADEDYSSHDETNQSMDSCSGRRKGCRFPEEKKDAAYWERRRKNNEAAKRSRDARRQKEDAMALRAKQLMDENMRFRCIASMLEDRLLRSEEQNRALIEEHTSMRDAVEKLLSKCRDCPSCQSNRGRELASVE